MLPTITDLLYRQYGKVVLNQTFPTFYNGKYECPTILDNIIPLYDPSKMDYSAFFSHNQPKN